MTGRRRLRGSRGGGRPGGGGRRLRHRNGRFRDRDGPLAGDGGDRLRDDRRQWLYRRASRQRGQFRRLRRDRHLLVGRDRELLLFGRDRNLLFGRPGGSRDLLLEPVGREDGHVVPRFRDGVVGLRDASVRRSRWLRLWRRRLRGPGTRGVGRRLRGLRLDHLLEGAPAPGADALHPCLVVVEPGPQPDEVDRQEGAVSEAHLVLTSHAPPWGPRVGNYSPARG
ncbi:MAG: hypothetical protein DMF83_03130 [Acidobacteria bacterium]|nr:MAG: hypothetical protein DMF83_03130 [Acidobacteriota bacterium]